MSRTSNIKQQETHSTEILIPLYKVLAYQVVGMCHSQYATLLCQQEAAYSARPGKKWSE